MTLVALSTDDADETLEFIEDEGIGYPIATDAEGGTVRAWGLSEKGETRSVPATFIVDAGRMIRFAKVGESMSDRVDLDELLRLLDRR